MTLATRNIKELIAQRRAELDAAKAIEGRALAAGRDVSDAELRQIQAHLAKADELKVPIEAAQAGDAARHEALKKLAEADAWGSQPQPGQQVRQTNPEHLSGPGSPGWGESVMRGRGRGRTYRELFGPPQGNDGFSTFGDFLSVVASGRYHERLRPAYAGMVGGTGSSGGYLIPEQHVAMLLDKSLENEIVRPRAKVHPMTGDTLKIAGFDTLDHSSTLFGGVTGQWVAEEGTISETDGKVRKIEMHAHKLATVSKASNELIQDGRDFEDLLGETLVAAVGWYLDYAFLRGTGAGQPLGVLNDPALVTVDAEDGQVAWTVLYANLVKMLSRLHPACYGNSVWVCSPTTIPELLQLTIRVQNAGGTDFVGGSHVQVLSQDGKGNYTMLGRPALFTEKLPSLGTAGDVLLADFSQYSIGLRKDVSVEKSSHLGFLSDTSYYRCLMRADGQGRWSKPMTPKSGDSLSWCVVLAGRS